MDVERLIKALNSATRRKIILLLVQHDMSASQVYKELKNNAPKYRQSVNKALDLLEECKIIEKYYDDKEKTIKHHLIKKEYKLILEKMEIE